MREIFTAVVCFSTFVGLAIRLLWIQDKLTFAWAEKSREKDAELLLSARVEIERQLQNPDWAFYEEHLQRAVPTALKALYAQPELILAQDLKIPDENAIGAFGPINRSNMIDAHEMGGFDIVPIATTDVGDPIFLCPGPNESDSIYIAHHDGGDIEPLAPSVSEFIALITRPS
jgi:hypothetical protein